MPKDASPQLNRKDLPADTRIPKDGSLRFTRPERIVTNAVTFLSNKNLPGRAPPAPKLYKDLQTYRLEVLQAINVNDARLGVFGVEYTRLPVGYSSWMQGGQIYLHPRIYEALSGLEIYDRARAVRVLAHEWWHASRVAPPETCPRLEEGLAELFAEQFCRNRLGTTILGPEAYAAELEQARRLALRLGEGSIERGMRQLTFSRDASNLRDWLVKKLGQAGFSQEEIQNLL